MFTTRAPSNQPVLPGRLQYKHSSPKLTVYKYPVEPSVIEQKTKKGKRIGWTVSMEVRVTRADNVLTQNRWKYPTSEYPRQPFDPRYSRDEVISYFYMHHVPDGDDITEAEYLALSARYDTNAGS